MKGALRTLTALSPKLTSHVAAELFVRPRRHRRPERERALLERAHRFSFLCGQRVLQGFSWGEGPAVMLVHGWEGRGAQLGEFVDPLVAAGYRVVTFDAPAHGDSPGRTALATDVALAARSLADWVGGVHAVVAHSMGSIAAVIAMKDGLRAERLVLVAPARDPEQPTNDLAEILDLPPSVVHLVRENIARRIGVPWSEVVAAHHYDGHPVPLLVFLDRDDAEIPQAAGEEIVTRWAGPAELVRSSGLGHRRILRDAGTIRRAVDFIGPPPPPSADPWARFLRFEADLGL